MTVPPRPGVPRRGVPRPEPSRDPSEASPRPFRDSRPRPSSGDRSRRTGTGATGREVSSSPPRKGATGRTTASWRVVVLILVLVLALSVLLPSLRAYSRQRERLDELRAEAEVAREEVASLEAEVARWDDPAYVIAQARERLSYILPGETPYRVVDPETVTGDQTDTSGPNPIPIRDGIPWYLNLWESLENPGDGDLGET